MPDFPTSSGRDLQECIHTPKPDSIHFSPGFAEECRNLHGEDPEAEWPKRLGVFQGTTRSLNFRSFRV